MKPKPVMQRRFFYTYGVKGIGIYAKPDFEDDNAPEAQEMLAKVRSKLNADLTARCISKRIREIPHCSATSVDLIHF